MTTILHANATHPEIDHKPPRQHASTRRLVKIDLLVAVLALVVILAVTAVDHLAPNPDAGNSDNSTSRQHSQPVNE